MDRRKFLRSGGVTAGAVIVAPVVVVEVLSAPAVAAQPYYNVTLSEEMLRQIVLDIEREYWFGKRNELGMVCYTGGGIWNG